MPGPNMSLAYRDDEIERQNFANEATLRCVHMYCPLAACVTLLACTGAVVVQDMHLLTLRQPAGKNCLLLCQFLHGGVSIMHIVAFVYMVHNCLSLVAFKLQVHESRYIR